MKRLNNVKKFITAAFAAVITVTSTPYTPAAAADSAAKTQEAVQKRSDRAFDDAKEFYDVTGILKVPSGEGLDNTSVSRGKFASLIGEITGGTTVSTTETVAEDDGWLWLGDRETGEAAAAQTGFEEVQEG